MASAPGGGAAAAPTVTEQPEPSGPLTALWTVTFALANLYALFFLVLAYSNARPQALRRLRARLARLWPAGRRSSPNRHHNQQQQEAAAARAGSSSLASGSGIGFGDASAERSLDGEGDEEDASSGGDAFFGQYDNHEQQSCPPSAPGRGDGADSVAAGGAPRASSATQPVELEWQGVSVGVVGVGGKRSIVEGVYGDALPGELQALMGPSGAGKST
jgi:hypothetical protein